MISEKKIFCWKRPPVMSWPVTIYTLRPNVWWVTNYHMCVRWKKKYFVEKDPQSCHDQWLYILWDLMCDGSPTITCVWDGRKNYFMFSMTHTNVWVFHSYVWYERKIKICWKRPPVMWLSVTIYKMCVYGHRFVHVCKSLIDSLRSNRVIGYSKSLIDSLRFYFA